MHHAELVTAFLGILEGLVFPKVVKNPQSLWPNDAGRVLSFP
jgi:hypothetical protein